MELPNNAPEPYFKNRRFTLVLKTVRSTLALRQAN